MILMAGHGKVYPNIEDVAVATPEATAALSHLRDLTLYKEAAALYRPTRLHISREVRAAVAEKLRTFSLRPRSQAWLRMITCKPRFGAIPYGFIVRPGALPETELPELDLSHLLLLRTEAEEVEAAEVQPAAAGPAEAPAAKKPRPAAPSLEQLEALLSERIASSQLVQYTVDQLKMLLHARQLTQSGTKTVLCERLEAHVRAAPRLAAGLAAGAAAAVALGGGYRG